MTIYLSDKTKFNKNDSYEVMMSYTTCIFNASEIDLFNIKNDEYIKATKIIWSNNDYLICEA